METQRKVLARPYPGRHIKRFDVADLEVILIARRIIPLHQQPAAVLPILPRMRDEYRLTEDTGFAGLDAPARPLLEVVAIERVESGPVLIGGDHAAPGLAPQRPSTGWWPTMGQITSGPLLGLLNDEWALA